MFQKSLHRVSALIITFVVYCVYIILLLRNAPSLNTEYVVLLCCGSVTSFTAVVMETTAANLLKLLKGISEESVSEGLLLFSSQISDLKKVSARLKTYYETNSTYVIILFCSLYIFKQTFAIPGSAVLNILSGSLFGLKVGFVLSCLLTSTGASFCYLLSNFCGKQIIVQRFPSKIASLKQTLDDNRSRLIYILLFLRLFPMTPNWFLNIASPIIDVPLRLFFISVFIGLMPYNYVCVQTGCILSELTSLDDIFTTSTILKLAAVALVALIPGLIARKNNMSSILKPVKQS